jgi:hypothetical protein
VPFLSLNSYWYLGGACCLWNSSNCLPGNTALCLRRHTSWSDILLSPTIYHVTTFFFFFLNKPPILCIFLLWLLSCTLQSSLPISQLSTPNWNSFVSSQILLLGSWHLCHSCVFHSSYRRQTEWWIFIFMTLALIFQFTFAHFAFASLLTDCHGSLHSVQDSTLLGAWVCCLILCGLH